MSNRRINKKLPLRKTYVLLSLTWGLPLTAFGALLMLILIICGKRPKRFCYCYYIEVGKCWGGLELGLFFLKDSRESLSLMKHEQGHGLQNIYWGVLMPFVITIPSAIRYWYRRALTARGRIDLVPYSAIWFEADADRRGAELYEYLTETRNRVNSTSL